MQTHVLIVGGGVAGLCAATELAGLGLESVIVEKAPFLGGHVARFCCKATDRCNRCAACHLEDLLQDVRSSDRITTLERAEVVAADSSEGRCRLSIAQRPHRIVPGLCDGCRECVRVCPEPGAIVDSPVAGRLELNQSVCRFFTDGSCRACEEVCPQKAVALGEPDRTFVLDASAIVLATGFKPFDASEKPRFGHGLVPGVVTALELEGLLRDENWTPPPTNGGTEPSVAFIQCVGSRDVKAGRNYCSRVCCGYALRLARLLKHRFPGLRPTMFYMDIQTFDRDFQRRLSLAEKEVALVRSIPAEIRKGVDGRPEAIYHGPQETRVVESFDLVVLSIGISPVMPDLPLPALAANEDGFVGTNGEAVVTNLPGVFVAGTLQAPRSIAETISHSIRAAGEAASYIRNISKG